jgi:hypothetical protein
MSDFAYEKAAGPDHEVGTLRLGTVTLVGEAAEWAKQQFAELHRAAYQHQGPRAFDDPKSSAVVHEAGHTVLYAHHGIEMRFVKVRECKKGIQRGHWVGHSQPHTYVSCGGPNTSAEDDLKNACIELAGWAAEALFDTDNMRRGSSLDEVIHARLLALHIAQKTGRDPHQVLLEIYERTFTILKKNEGVVREIASLLDRKGVIRRTDLASILAKVERPS